MEPSDTARMILRHKLALEGRSTAEFTTSHSMCKALGLTLPSPAELLQVHFKGEGQSTAEPKNPACESRCPVRTGAEQPETGLEQPVGLAEGSGGARLHLPKSQNSPVSSEPKARLQLLVSHSLLPVRTRLCASIQAPNASVFCSFMTAHKLPFLSRGVGLDFVFY